MKSNTGMLLKAALLVAPMMLSLMQMAQANTLNAAPVPLDHCYHWLQTGPGYLDFKYTYAKDNGNELTFFTSPGTSNGSVAGPGLYCAKSPSQSYGYGNRVIRIEFVRDVVMLDAFTGRKYCGTDGRFYKSDAECQSKEWDVKYYNRSPDWYVIQNPRAVKSWSAAIPSVISDLQSEMNYGDGGYRAHAQAVIGVVQTDIQQNGERNFVNSRARMGFAEIVKSDKLLNSLPALTILAEFNGDQIKKIDATLLDSVLTKTVDRVLQDVFLPWSDVKPLLKSNKKIKAALIAGTQKKIATLAKDETKNFEVMMMITAQKDAGFTPEQIQSLITETFKNPANFSQTRFAKGDLTDDLKKQITVEVTARVQAPETKNDISMIASLVSFISLNKFDDQLKKDVNALFYEQVKTMTASKYTLGKGSTKYPLGDTVQIATQLCQAHIAAYNLTNKDLTIGAGKLRLDVGQISTLANAASFCQQQSGLMDVLAKMPQDGGQVYTVTGTLQTVPFKIIAVDQESAEVQMRSFLKKTPVAKVDKIIFQVNDGQVQSITNGPGYWEGDEIVTNFAKGLSKAGISPRQQVIAFADIIKRGKNKAKKIEVSFQGNPMKFNADVLEDFDEACQAMAPTLNGLQVDRIVFSIDGVVGTPVTNGGWWTSGAQSCAAVRPSIKAAGLPSSQEKINLNKIAQLAKGKSRQLTVTFKNQFNVTIGANAIEDFDEQCKLMGTTVDGIQYDAVRASAPATTNDKAISVGASTGGWWHTAAEGCTELRKQLLVGGLSSRAHQSALVAIKNNISGKAFKIDTWFEGTQVTFGANNIEEFDTQCLTLNNGLDGRDMDDVRFVINDKDQGNVTTGGWWKTAAEACAAVRPALIKKGVGSAVKQKAVAEIERRSKGKLYQITLTLDEQKLKFGVNNINEFNEQCALLGNSMDGLNIGRIYFSVNNPTPIEISFGGYINSTAIACQTASQTLSDALPTKEVQEVFANRSKYRYTFDVRLDQKQFTLAVNEQNELRSQCIRLINSMGVQRTYSISLGKDYKFTRAIEKGNAGWYDVKDMCNDINTYSFGFIPSPEQQAISELQAVYDVQVLFNGMPMQLKASNADQVYGQCLNIMDEAPNFRFTEMIVSLIKGNTRTINEQRIWSKSEACKVLANQFRVSR
jgi:hypothetical protein